MPADLRSAGIEYQDLLIRLLPILLLHHLYFTLISGTFSRSKISCTDLGSDIIFRQIFRYAQQLVQISRHISIVDSYRTHYVSIWIFHSSLLTLHFRQVFFTFNFSFLIALCACSSLRKSSFNYRETKASPRGRFGGAFTL